jgi:hypothetical protein
MPFVKRDEQGAIVAVSQELEPGFSEELPGTSEELASFLHQMEITSSIDATDQGFVRVLEDVVELLIEKGVILFTDLPESAQEKVILRQKLRSELGAKLDLIGDD